MQWIKKEFLDEDDTLKLDLVEKYVEKYVDDKIKEKYGDEFSLDVMDDTINISWDIKVNSIIHEILCSKGSWPIS